MRVLSVIVLGAAALGLTRAAAADGKADHAKKIVGKWEVTKSQGDEPVGSMMEFTKDGKCTFSARLGDKDVTLDGTYTIDKDQLTVELTVAGKAAKDVDTIKKLTDDDLELENKAKKVTVLKRKK